MHWKFPSTKFIKEDYDQFVPADFKEKMLALDSSYESEEENPLKKLEEQEAVEFYNMVRSIFSSANINLKNEQLYSPLLEALIKNYSNKLSKREDNSFTNNSRRNSNWNLTMKVGPIPKFKSLQTQLLDLKSSQQLGEGMIFKENKPKKVKILCNLNRNLYLKSQKQNISSMK